MRTNTTTPRARAASKCAVITESDGSFTITGDLWKKLEAGAKRRGISPTEYAELAVTSYLEQSQGDAPQLA
jgi:hypothetical protein